MNFESRRQFLTKTMSMTHIYQPVVIRTLLEKDGVSSIREIATEFLSYDEAQVEYYIKIAKKYPKETLLKHGVIDTSERGYFKLILDDENLNDTPFPMLATPTNKSTSRIISEKTSWGICSSSIKSVRFAPPHTFSP